MAEIYDEATGLSIGSPEKGLIELPLPYTPKELQQRLNAFILSASGWRCIFALDGNAESPSEHIREIDIIITSVMAQTFAQYIQGKTGKKNPTIVLGLDSRPTGPAIGEVFCQIWSAMGIKVRYLFIASAPEIMAYTKVASDTDGFVYISASHNPIGYNGIKLGLSDGSVLQGKENSKLVDTIKDVLSSEPALQNAGSLLMEKQSAALETIYKDVADWKQKALNTYYQFTCNVITAEEIPERQQPVLEKISANAAGNIAILADLNGSARTVSIDNRIFKDHGIDAEFINGKPREIAHRIVPEGESLNQCRWELENRYKEDNRFQIGYVPDNDGDRGNIVFIDSATGKAQTPDAQQVFALCCAAELSYLVYAGKLKFNADGTPDRKVAVVVNGPTSMRIDEIAAAFGAEVHRAEVGEANVVGKALKLQQEGYTVRILGEGSNGGNITLPSTVRDPVNTVFAILKFLLLKSEKGNPGLFEIWLQRSGKQNEYTDNFSLSDIINSLPAYTTTSAYEDKAMMRIKSQSHAALKQAYEELFITEWEEKKQHLASNFQINDFEIRQYEGLFEYCGGGPQHRSKAGKGGLTIRLLDNDGYPAAYLWMRGSGTEPVFRVLTDVKGTNPEAEEYLLSWHRDMIEKADRTASWTSKM